MCRGNFKAERLKRLSSKTCRSPQGGFAAHRAADVNQLVLVDKRPREFTNFFLDCEQRSLYQNMGFRVFGTFVASICPRELDWALAYRLGSTNDEIPEFVCVSCPRVRRAGCCRTRERRNDDLRRHFQRQFVPGWGWLRSGTCRSGNG